MFIIKISLHFKSSSISEIVHIIQISPLKKDRLAVQPFAILIKGTFLMKVSLELRYGREDEEMMGLQFCNEMGLLNLCIHPDKVPPLLVQLKKKKK